MADSFHLLRSKIQREGEREREGEGEGGLCSCVGRYASVSWAAGTVGRLVDDPAAFLVPPPPGRCGVSPRRGGVSCRHAGAAAARAALWVVAAVVALLPAQTAQLP